MPSLDVRRIIQQAAQRDLLEPHERFVEVVDDLVSAVVKLRGAGCSIVLTQGTWDIFHIGHSRYVRKAKEYGDILVVGVDDDEKARGRKGEGRPVIGLLERMEQLCHTRYVDIVVVKHLADSKWHITKAIRPDVLIAVEGTYQPQDLEDLKEFCGKVVVLPRQAETSTSAKVRKLVLDGAENITRILSEELPPFIRGIYERLKEGKV